MTLHTFTGGLELEGHKASSLERSIANLPLPERLIMSLTDDRNLLCRPIVKSRQSVALGQTIAVPTKDNGLPIIASAAGMIGDIHSGSYIELLPNQVPDKTTTESTHSDTVVASNLAEKLKSAPLVGLGGAAYPTSQKLSSIADKPPDTLIINAAECEPVIACDQALIREASIEIIAGAEQLLIHSDARRCLIGIEDNKPKEIKLLATAIQHRGNSAIDLVVIPTRYPTGGEKQLIKVLTGREVPYQKLPRDVGVICFNVATAHAIYQLLRTNQPQVSRVVTVSGTAIEQPRNLRVVFGTPLAHVVRYVAPALSLQIPSLTITVGGPMTGTVTSDFNQPVSASTNCVIVNYDTPQKSESPCIRCGYCDQVCPAGLLPQQLHWYCRNQSYVEAAGFRLDACIECACCDYVCPSGIPLTEQFRHAKASIVEQQGQQDKARRAKARFDNRETRLAKKAELRQQRLDARKGAKEAIQAALARSKAARKPDPKP